MPYTTPPTRANPLAWRLSRQAVIGIILLVALFAFEIFNYDTTEFALANLLSGANFAGISWSAILAFAFCSIDFAGLAHLFTPQPLREEGKEIYYLMGAWLLGATMNALMTWWAVTLLIIQHPLVGNEVLSHAQLVDIVPIFVAVLVWLTRILFIGALSVAGEQFFQQANAQPRPQRQNLPMGQPIREKQPRPRVVKQPDWSLPEREEMPAFTQQRQTQPRPTQQRRTQTELGVTGMSASPRQYD